MEPSKKNSHKPKELCRVLEHVDAKKYRNLYVSTIANPGLIALLLSREPLSAFSIFGCV